MVNKTIYSEEHKKIVSKLKASRIAAGLSQKEIAAALDKTQSYVSKIENGQSKLDIVMLKKFIHIYKKKMEDFV